MKQLRITNIQRGCVYDGPGVRTTVFLKGCTLRCPWCCNPETISYEKDRFIDDEKCMLFLGRQSHLCEQCERNLGFRTIDECPFGVVEDTYRDYEVEELLEILLNDSLLFKETNGGVTFSGGEPLLQAEALTPLLIKLKEKSVHIAFETTLVSQAFNLKQIIPYTDYFIVDLKFQPQMNLFNLSYLSTISKLYNLLKCKDVANRMVFVDEMEIYKDLIVSRLNALGVSKLELIGCHSLGEKKYIKLKMPNTIIEASINKLESFRDYLKRSGIEVFLLTI